MSELKTQIRELFRDDETLKKYLEKNSITGYRRFWNLFRIDIMRLKPSDLPDYLGRIDSSTRLADLPGGSKFGTNLKEKLEYFQDSLSDSNIHKIVVEACLEMDASLKKIKKAGMTDNMKEQLDVIKKKLDVWDMGTSIMSKTFRIIVFTRLQLLSPLQIGSGEENPYSDQPVLRDSRGIPFIPGGTLAGSFSSVLTEDQKTAWMGQPLDQGSPPKVSSFIFDDAYPLEEQRSILQYPVEQRFLNTLIRDTNTGKPDHHFSAEVLPVGTQFCVACRCDVHSEKEKAEIKKALVSFLSQNRRLGKSKNSGLGLWKCSKWACNILSMHCPDDLKKWVTDLHGYVWNGSWDDLEAKGFEIDDITQISPSEEWHVQLDVDVDSGLHLSSGPSGLPLKKMSDLSQAKRPVLDESGQWKEKEFVDFGSSIKGRIRSAMEMVLRTWLLQFATISAKPKDKVCQAVPLDPTQKSSLKELADFFGHTEKKGSFLVEECPWNGEPEEERQDHIKLDEFTQQTLRGAKFDFAPIHKGETKVVIILPSGAEDWQKYLVFGACKLLALNILPWAGHGSRGYLGAKIKFPQEAEIENKLKTFDHEDWLRQIATEINK